MFACKYSIDKIKLVCKLNAKKQTAKQKKYIDYISFYNDMVYSHRLAERFQLTVVEETENKLNRFKYRYGFKLQSQTDIESVIWLALCYNGGFEKPNEKLFQVEFNPNKTDCSFVDYILDLYGCVIQEIKYIDLAFDIPFVDVSQININTRKDVMTYGTTKTRTLYIGPKARSGRVKIYQKDVERKLVQKTIDKTLRIEISIRGDWLIQENYYKADTQDLIELCDTLNSISWVDNDSSNDAMLYLLLNANEFTRLTALYKMSEATRIKYKKLIALSSLSLNIEPIELANILLTLLKKYIKKGKTL